MRLSTRPISQVDTPTNAATQEAGCRADIGRWSTQKAPPLGRGWLRAFTKAPTTRPPPRAVWYAQTRAPTRASKETSASDPTTAPTRARKPTSATTTTRLPDTEPKVRR